MTQPLSSPDLAAAPGGWTLDSAWQALSESLIQMPLRRDSSIHFEWGGNRWLQSCQMNPGGQDHSALLRGFLGFLPFSAENRTARKDIIDAVAQVPHASRGQLRIDRRGRLFFRDTIVLPDPVTPQSLLTAAVVMLLQAQPIITAIRPFLTGKSISLTGKD